MPEEHPERHEHQDINAKTVALFGGGLLLTVGVVLLFMIALLAYFASRPAGSVGPLAGMRVEPPEPRLQVSPPQDLQKMRESEDALLYNYGWVDRKAGVVRIPIDRAMELIVERGLPARSEAEVRK